MNKIGKIINVPKILKPHMNEVGCSTSNNVLRYLSCNEGEVYVAFNDPNNIHFGKLCKIKVDRLLGTLAAFDKTDNKDQGTDLYAMVYFENYEYIMRLS